MAFAQYYEPIYSKKLNRHTIGEPISRERYQWIKDNLPKLSNNHNPDLTDGQLEYLLSIKAVFPGKADKAPQNGPEYATAANGAVNETWIHETQGKMAASGRD